MGGGGGEWSEESVSVSYSWEGFPGVSGDKARCLRIRGSSKELRGKGIYEYIVIYSNAQMQISYAQDVYNLHLSRLSIFPHT